MRVLTNLDLRAYLPPCVAGYWIRLLSLFGYMQFAPCDRLWHRVAGYDTFALVETRLAAG